MLKKIKNISFLFTLLIFIFLTTSYYFSDKNVHFKVSENSYLYLERYDNNMEIGYNVTLENFPVRANSYFVF